MLTPTYTRQFERDLKLMLKRGNDPEKLKLVITTLINEEPLPSRHRDHALVGNFRDRRECHVEPDWLLIYKILVDEIIFERTGSHSDLFK